MIAVDSSALIAIIRDETEAEMFDWVMAASDRCLVSAVTVMEASIVLAGARGAASAWDRLEEILAVPNVEVVPHDRTLAELARDAFLRFGKGRHPAALNMGDCASYALAKARAVPLLFKGRDFAQTDLAAAS